MSPRLWNLVEVIRQYQYKLAVIPYLILTFITPQYFNWSQDNTEAKSSLRRKNEAAMLRYRASLINQPSLPSWLKYHYSKDYKTGLLYGVPKLSAQYRLQIVATDRDTFETGKDN